jgi:hypothetical protein
MPYTYGMIEPTNSELLTYEEATNLAARAAKVFQPRTPITTTELFAGRWNELTAVADAVNQPGLHVVIYGERGVGKSSLANVVKPTIWTLDNMGKDRSQWIERLVIKAVASSGDTFSKIWDNLFKELAWNDDRPVAGMLQNLKKRISIREAFDLTDTLQIDDVRRVLSNMPGAVFIVDEFDRAVTDTSREFTDLIKSLSDFAIDCTVILVGVSDTVDKLIADHASIHRALIEILLHRMKPEELTVILQNAEKSLSVNFSEDAKKLIVRVSQGLPHYTHLIGLHAVRMTATERFSRSIDRSEVFEALKKAVTQAEQTITDKHSRATHSAHKDALYRHVLLACALTAASSHDALGYFNPAALVDPLGQILGRDVAIATFSNHLSEFCQEKRASVLERDGQPWGYRFRFRDPLLVPYVFMNAVDANLISGEKLVQMLEETH